MLSPVRDRAQRGRASACAITEIWASSLPQISSQIIAARGANARHTVPHPRKAMRVLSRQGEEQIMRSHLSTPSSAAGAVRIPRAFHRRESGRIGDPAALPRPERSALIQRGGKAGHISGSGLNAFSRRHASGQPVRCATRAGPCCRRARSSSRQYRGWYRPCPAESGPWLRRSSAAARCKRPGTRIDP